LNALAGEGWRLAVCTNKPEAATHAVLSALGIEHMFCAIGAGDTFPVRKPDPAHLLATLRAAGGTPDAVIMAGDHSNDVQAARGAGVPGVFCRWGYGAPEMADGAAAVAEDFPELGRIVRRLLG
jgi:phosphoglycolate phosphatase